MLLSLLILILAFILNLMLPWWSIALPGLVLGYYYRKPALPSFGWGFLALFVLWTAEAWYIHSANDGLLTGRIAEMLQLNAPFWVILITGLIGGLVSGVATMSGSLISDLKTTEAN